ncbi:MAG: NosD domain-containing protein [Candidatus Thermoplasmatota archaeon]|nr:NosD domain-containing protein [Candidatus Thermoplasmatota archaeon]
MRAKKLAMLFLLAVSLVTASILITGMKELEIMEAKASPDGGNTFYVGGSGPNNYSKIQDAIDNAQDGDTIFVYSGTYYENVVVDKRINLMGEDRDTTIIDGDYNDNCIFISANNVCINRFMIRNSTNGIYAKSSSNIIISANIIENCFQTRRSGIRIVSSSAAIYNNIIRNNYRGIFIQSNSNATCYNNTVVYNRGDWPGDTETGNGIYVENSVAKIYDNNISYNRPHATLIKYKSPVEIYNNIMDSNYEDAVDYEHCTNGGVVHNNTITNSPATGILVEYDSWNSYITLRDNFISNCGTDSGWGSGIALQDCTEVFVINNTVTNCREAGVDLWRVFDIAVTNNELTNNAQGIYLRNSNNSTVTGNIAYSNDIYGIQIDVSNNNILINNRVASNNHGIHITESSKYNQVINCTVYNNSGNGIRIRAGSDNNIIYRNDFVDNTQNAYDECNNTWDNGYPSGGNYWSDFDEPNEGAYDNDIDGIVDVPYNIPGGNNRDRYPLMNPLTFDNTPPSVEILCPQNYLYIFDRKIIPIRNTIIVCKITIVVDASDETSGMTRVEFYVDDELEETIVEEPYQWLWDEVIFGRHTIKIIAYDKAGNEATDEQEIWIFNI